VHLPSRDELTNNATTLSSSRHYTFGGQTVAIGTSRGLGGVTSLVSDRNGSLVAAIPNNNWRVGVLSPAHSDSLSC
jgi:hypothetical protein